MLLPHNPNAFTRSPLDRAGHHRRDKAWLEAALAAPETQLVPFHRHQPFVMEEGGVVTPGWLNGAARSRIAPPDATALFLGLDPNGAAHFALDIPDPAPLGDLGRFEDLRMLGPRLSRDELAILGPAKSIFEWHARNGYCANCGTPTLVVEAGWRRDCPSCSVEHYPRFDPVCIMVPTFGDKVFLGRQRAWPRGMHSALAGFIEPGEAIEEGVARETLEEAGLKVREVRMHSTQPWPFPHSLMIGVLCEVENDRETVDTTELESGRWFTRDEAKLLIAGKHPDAWAPPPFAIAHQLLKTWSEE
ncbi:MAG: NAD(+) diphosphatase [Hyphomonadaceae bacterium JAD_PAG50586_4]|nr:MAG: NAD(+) diphosphatase [Hyphomonadaceae bacterium JAD_PAG50586_4]